MTAFLSVPTSELAMSLGCPRGPKHSQSNVLLTSDGVMQQGVKDELQLADSMRSKVRLGRGTGRRCSGRERYVVGRPVTIFRSGERSEVIGTALLPWRLDSYSLPTGRVTHGMFYQLNFPSCKIGILPPAS